MKKLRLAVVFGGNSSEYPVSLHSVESVLEALDTNKYEITRVGISREGNWFLYEGEISKIGNDTWQEADCTPCVLSCSPSQKGFLKIKADGTYEVVEVDCIFPVLHGKNGEDGTMQGLFALSGIPYVGCGHLSSAVCMDKEMTHIILENASIPCAPYMCVYEEANMDYAKLFEEAKAKLALPFFVKPANAGSSFGIHKVTSFDSFEADMKDAFFHDGKGKVILETTIEGFEIGCAVMGNKEVFVGSVDEVQTSAPFFDYAGKYQMKDSQIYCPARIEDVVFEEARSLAKKAYQALNCAGMARVDMFVQPNQKLVVNEVNTIPGFTATSRYPSMMKEVGIAFHELLDQLIAFAME